MSGYYSTTDGAHIFRRLNDETTTGYSGPYVVIDPENREQVERLASAYVAAAEAATQPYGVGDVDRAAVAREMTAALREFANPTPKPNEPLGLGAVVEDADGFKWVRTHVTGYPWKANLEPDDRNVTASRKYAEVTAVRILSPGYTEDGA